MHVCGVCVCGVCLCVCVCVKTTPTREVKSIEHITEEVLKVKKDNCQAVQLISNPKVRESHMKERGKKDPSLGRMETIITVCHEHVLLSTLNFATDRTSCLLYLYIHSTSYSISHSWWRYYYRPNSRDLFMISFQYLYTIR